MQKHIAYTLAFIAGVMARLHLYGIAMVFTRASLRVVEKSQLGPITRGRVTVQCMLLNQPERYRGQRIGEYLQTVLAMYPNDISQLWLTFTLSTVYHTDRSREGVAFKITGVGTWHLAYSNSTDAPTRALTNCHDILMAMICLSLKLSLNGLHTYIESINYVINQLEQLLEREPAVTMVLENFFPGIRSHTNNFPVNEKTAEAVMYVYETSRVHGEVPNAIPADIDDHPELLRIAKRLHLI